MVSSPLRATKANVTYLSSRSFDDISMSESMVSLFFMLYWLCTSSSIRRACTWRSSCIQVQRRRLQAALFLASISQGARLWASSWCHCFSWLFFGDLQGNLWPRAFLQPPICDIIVQGLVELSLLMLCKLWVQKNAICCNDVIINHWIEHLIKEENSLMHPLLLTSALSKYCNFLYVRICCQTLLSTNQSSRTNGDIQTHVECCTTILVLAQQFSPLIDVARIQWKIGPCS